MATIGHTTYINAVVQCPPHSTEHGTINLIEDTCYHFFDIHAIQKFGLLQKPSLFVSPLPRDIAELHKRITRDVNKFDSIMLICLWQELDYCMDGCGMGGKSSHVQHL
ncbi:hypothetical protein TNCV_3820691 [Trichonephila clavipes]|nr:hypothetical protein TNCV_3820691 [Trichonephila clavipes]